MRCSQTATPLCTLLWSLVMLRVLVEATNSGEEAMLHAPPRSALWDWTTTEEGGNAAAPPPLGPPFVTLQALNWPKCWADVAVVASPVAAYLFTIAAAAGVRAAAEAWHSHSRRRWLAATASKHA